MYKVVWQKKAEEDLRKIRRADPSTAQEIKSRVESHLATNPKQNGKPLEHKWEGYYRYSVGDYRVIYEIEERQLIILVVEVGERKARQPGSIYGRKPPRRTSTIIQRPRARDFKRKTAGNRGKRKLGRK